MIIESWQNVVGNLYQSILGSHEERVLVISTWLSDIKSTPADETTIEHMVRICAKKYKTNIEPFEFKGYTDER